MTDDISDVTIIKDGASIGPASGGGAASLVVIYGEFLGRRYQIDGVPLLVGRAPECTVQITDDSVSRKHCRIVSSDGTVVLSDLNSTNGTYVNGTTVSARPLRDGDRIQVGRSIFKFLSGENIEHAYHEEIYRLKTVDGLTGAFNKRTFDEELRREIHRFFRYGRPLCLVMFDIDHFKKVNDTWGHLAGDRVLSEIGELLNRVCRKEDTLCRYGGEEFAMLCPEMPVEEAIAMANELREAVESHAFEFDGAEIPITISAGVAEARDNLEGPEEFVADADKQLYRAKDGGRNRVEPADYDRPMTPTSSEG